MDEFEPLGVRLVDSLIVGRGIRAWRRVRRLELRLEVAKLEATFWQREWDIRRKSMEEARKVAPRQEVD